MNSDPISKKQVYTDRYGEVPAQNQPQGDYEGFDVNGTQGRQHPDAINPEAYVDMAAGELGEGVEDADLFSGMSEEEYVAHYRNNVAPGNRREAEALMQEMGERGEAVFDPRRAVSQLKAELNKSENALFLDEDAKEHFTGKLRELERLVGKQGTDLGELQDRIEGVQEELMGAIEEGRGIRQEKISTMKGMTEDLLEDVEKSRIPEEKKSELESKLEALKSDLKKSNVDAEAAREELEAVQKDFRKEKMIDEIKDKLETLPSKIPGEGHHKEESAILASKIAQAVRTDNWDEVRNFLTFYRTNDLNKPNNFIPQVIGTIFMDLAGSDEAKLDEILSVFPAEIRTLMADVAPGDDPNSTDHLNEPAKYKYYGRPNATADRLRASRIDEAGEHLGEIEESALSRD